MDRSQGPKDSGLAALVTVLRLYQLPADPIQLQHQFAEPGRTMRRQDLLRACKRLGLRARETPMSVDELAGVSLPVIAIDRCGEFFVIARASRQSGADAPQLGDRDARDAAHCSSRASVRMSMAWCRGKLARQASAMVRKGAGSTKGRTASRWLP